MPLEQEIKEKLRPDSNDRDKYIEPLSDVFRANFLQVSVSIGKRSDAVDEIAQETDKLEDQRRRLERCARTHLKAENIVRVARLAKSSTHGRGSEHQALGLTTSY